MSTEQMRIAIARAYPGAAFKKKLDAMPSHQVHAMYSRLLAQKKLA